MHARRPQGAQQQPRFKPSLSFQFHLSILKVMENAQGIQLAVLIVGALLVIVLGAAHARSAVRR